MELKTISVTLYAGGYLECTESECPHSRECANHSSAGDFRVESGLQPKIVNVNGSSAQCASFFVKEEDCEQGPALLVEDCGIGITEGGRMVADAVHAARYMKIAQDWVDRSTHFGSAKTVARAAVAEFVANQEGYTLYDW